METKIKIITSLLIIGAVLALLGLYLGLNSKPLIKQENVNCYDEYHNVMLNQVCIEEYIEYENVLYYNLATTFLVIGGLLLFFVLIIAQLE